MIPKHSASLAVLLFCTSVLGQSATSAAHLPTVHVFGTVGRTNDSIVPGTEVTFRSNQVTRTTLSDGKGFYQVDLPLGLYTITAHPLESVRPGYRYLQKYSRPLFRVD
jgi:hypothetical protein